MFNDKENNKANKLNSEIPTLKSPIVTSVPKWGRILALQSETQYGGTLKVSLNKLGISFNLISVPYPYVGGSFTNKFNAIDFDDYDLIIVGSRSYSAEPSQEVSDALYGRKYQLQQWISSGGGLVVLSQHELTDEYSYLPSPPESFDQSGDDVNIVKVEHPMMKGLTNDFLSNWNRSYHNYFEALDPAYEILCKNNNGKTIIAAETYGSGRIAITGLDPDWHYGVEDKLGAGMLIDNMSSWALRAQQLYRGIIFSV